MDVDDMSDRRFRFLDFLTSVVNRKTLMPKFVPVLVTITFLVVILSGFLWKQLHAEREQAGKLRDRLTQLEMKQGSVASRLATLVAPSNAAMAPTTDAPGLLAIEQTPSRRVRIGTFAAGTGKSATSFAHELLKDSEYREAQRLQLRATLARSYPDVARELDLTLAETDALFELISQSTMDAMVNSLHEDDNQPSNEVVMHVAQQTQRDQEVGLFSLLGSERYQKWREYEQSMPARQEVSQLRGALLASGVPLGEEQAKSLATVVVIERRHRATETSLVERIPTDPLARTHWMEDGLGRIEESNRRLLAAAAPYLDSRQLVVYERILNQKLAMMRAQQRVRMTRGDSPEINENRTDEINSR